MPRQRIEYYKGEIKDILKCIFTVKLIKGKYIKKFETEFAKYVGVKHAIAVNSGRLALYLILRSYNLKKGDEIILPAYNYYVIPKIIQLLGLKPVFVDVDENTFTVDPSQIPNKVTYKTKAIILTHVFGQPCDINKILSIAKRHNLKIIEDCAHALGSEYDGKKVGSFETGIFSFEVTKHINTFGGGMIATNDDALNKKIRDEVNKYSCPANIKTFKKMLKALITAIITNPIIFPILVYPFILILNLFNINLGSEKVKANKIKINKYKQKFSNIQALVGLNQLMQLKVLNKKREGIAKLYSLILKNNIDMQKNIKNARPNYMLFSVRHKNRDKIIKYLLKKGIDTKKDYMVNCPNFFGEKEKCINSEKLSETVFHLPFYEQLSTKNISYIANTLNNIIKCTEN